MKKVINGKLYDTDTARMLGAWESTWDVRDFDYVSETLYIKRTGEYFLHGEGGPSSKYARTTGQNSWSSGAEIMPLSAAAAREWAEDHLDADKYAAIFGVPDEDAEPVHISIQIPADVNAQIRAQAAERGESLMAYIVDILRGACRG